MFCLGLTWSLTFFYKISVAGSRALSFVENTNYILNQSHCFNFQINSFNPCKVVILGCLKFISQILRLYVCLFTLAYELHVLSTIRIISLKTFFLNIQTNSFNHCQVVWFACIKFINLFLNFYSSNIMMNKLNVLLFQTRITPTFHQFPCESVH